MTDQVEGIPTLRAFLGDGSRSADFADFQEYVRDLMVAYPDAVGEQKQLVRFMQAFSIAAVEVAHQETQSNATPDQVLDIGANMVTAAMLAVGHAILSVLSDDVPAEVFSQFMLDHIEQALAETIRVQGLK